MAQAQESLKAPFPGMNLYLEHPDLWLDAHNRLITMTANALTPQLRPRYYAAIEERVYLAAPKRDLAGRADVGGVEVKDEPAEPRLDETAAPYRPVLIDLPVPQFDEIRETYLEVREAAGGQVITVIELLSPTNKQRGSEGYRLYLQKRLVILNSQTNLVEIDLLRAGKPLPVSGNPPPSDYRVIVSQSWNRPQAHLYPFSIREPIPDCPVPLRSETEPQPVLSLQNLLLTLYEQAGYDLRINYGDAPVPLLRPEDAAWANGLLRAAGLRGDS